MPHCCCAAGAIAPEPDIARHSAGNLNEGSNLMSARTAKTKKTLILESLGGCEGEERKREEGASRLLYELWHTPHITAWVICSSAGTQRPALACE